MDEDAKIFTLAFLLFIIVVCIDIEIVPKIPETSKIPYLKTVMIYWLVLYGIWLGFIPLYAMFKKSLRWGSELFGFTAVLWSFEDTLYYFLLGYDVLNPFDYPGMYPLLFNWYPIWLLISVRLAIGLAVLIFLIKKPAWGRNKLLFSRRQVISVAFVGVLVFSIWYLDYSRAFFGGKMLHEMDLSYKTEPCEEKVFRGILRNMTFMRGPNRAVLYTLEHKGKTGQIYYRLATHQESKILDTFIDEEVEILGKLIEVKGFAGVIYKEILIGRIRKKKS